VPASVHALLEKGETWYQGRNADFVVAKKAYVPLPKRDGVISLEDLRDRVIVKNDSASLIDLGDGIACVEFHSKMNSLGQGVLEILGKAVPLAKEKGMRGVVIGNEGENFSVGADAFMILALAGQSKWKELDEAVNVFQQTLMGLRHAELPVVVATHGMALGGGCETAMHAAAVVAAAESYIGLVEIGVGLLPAGGGLKEIVRRASKWAAQAPEGDPYHWVRRGFEKVAQAAVATSAHEGRKAGWLRATDRIVFNKDRLLAEAKRTAISLAEGGYEPPDRNEPIRVIGASRGASFLLGAQLFEWGGYASAHDKLIGQKIAHVLSGGMSQVPRALVAQDLLDLEREAFVSLCGEQKTRDRIAHMLSTGKPLRN
jgi:3-hydroxyacyl-CoA dehydrogenase